MLQRIINRSYFENEDLMAFMRNNGYPFKINNGIIRFEMDLYKYVSLDDLLVDYAKQQYIQVTQKFLDQIADGLEQLIQHLNEKNLQYFILKNDQIFIEIKEGQFKQIVLTHLTKIKQQQYSIDFKQIIPKKPWYQFAWIFSKNIEFCEEFIDQNKEIKKQIQEYSEQYQHPLWKIIREYIDAYVFRQIIDTSFDQDKFKILCEIYFTSFKRDNITDEILEDFMNQSYNLEKFNDSNYIYRLIFLQEIYQYSKIYRKQYQRQIESKEQRKQIQITNRNNKIIFIQELLDQISCIINIDKEQLTKELINFNCDITDNNSKLALVNQIQLIVLDKIEKVVSQIN